MGNRNGIPISDEDKLKKIYAKYEKHILPLEAKSLFNSLGDQAYTETELLAKPMILVIGQYSTGKTTFIKALLSGREYPGMHIAADQATDNFMPIMRGDKKDSIPGNALVHDQSKPFGAFATAFGENIRLKLKGAILPKTDTEEEDDILDDVIIIDTPGTLDGAADTRGYNFAEVAGWFASRASLILILFDVHKMGVSAEMKTVLDNIAPNKDKIRFIFNKADTVSEIDLMSSVSGLKFNLAQAMPKYPEPPEIYTTSLHNLEDDYRTDNPQYIKLFASNKQKLIDDIQMVRDDTITRKINIIDKRVRLVRNQADVMRHFRKEQRKCLSLFHRTLNEKDKKKLMDAVPEIYQNLQKNHDRSSEEFLPVESFKAKLMMPSKCDLNNLPKIKEKNITKCYDKMQKAIKESYSSK